jgi:hypothetical protein
MWIHATQYITFKIIIIIIYLCFYCYCVYNPIKNSRPLNLISRNITLQHRSSQDDSRDGQKRKTSAITYTKHVPTVVLPCFPFRLRICYLRRHAWFAWKCFRRGPYCAVKRPTQPRPWSSHPQGGSSSHNVLHIRLLAALTRFIRSNRPNVQIIIIHILINRRGIALGNLTTM